MTRHSMKNYRVLYSLVDSRGLQLRLALGDSIATAFTQADSRGGTWGPFGIVL